MTPGPGIEPGTHWQEASALTTTPTLLPNVPDRIAKLTVCKMRRLNQLNAYFNSMRASRIFD